MKAPKFIANTSDDRHCVQASVGMVLDYFLPERKFSMHELEKLTGFVKDKGAYEMEELLNYEKLGLEATVITDSSYEEFAKRGFDYIDEVEGPEAAAWAKANTGDIELEKRRAAQIAERGIHIYRRPNNDDIQRFIDDGWLVMLSVNARKLSGKSGFVGHRILVYAVDEKGVTMHDPGSPPYEARKVDWHMLENAWSDPKESPRILIAVRKQER